MYNLKFKIKIFVLFSTFYILHSTFALPAEAHTLKTDGSIGAVLHVDPDDEPYVGTPTGFYFEFKDKQNKFTATDCTCTFIISEDNKQLYSQPLFQSTTDPSLNSPALFYTFPEKGVYQATVTGTSNTKSFPNFKLVYDIRVDRENATQTTPTSTSTQNNSFNNWFSTHVIHLIGGSIVIAFFIFALIKQSRDNSKNQT